MCIFEDLVDFFYVYNSTVVCIVKLTGHLLSDEILLAVLEWEREGMRITNENGKGMGINYREWEGMGLKKTFPLISS